MSLGDDGVPKETFLAKHCLNVHSMPHEWFAVFLPASLTRKWTTFTNTKALLANAGCEGGIYPDFFPFTPFELRKHIAVYFVNGLAPSPKVAMKFQSQAQNDINGNYFVKRCLGPAAERRHRHFRRFFAVQNPLLAVPLPKTAPNHKVVPFLDWIKM